MYNSPMKNKTAEFLGADYNWSKAQIELRDVQPFMGGVRVLLPYYTISHMFVTQVAPGGGEAKFKVPLGLDEKKELCALCVKHDFVTIAPEERAGLPDEGRPTITLSNRHREQVAIAKWAGVRDARFDAIYDTLLALAARTDGQRPMASRLTGWQKGLFVSGVLAFLAPLVGLAHLPARALAVAWWPGRVGWLLGLLLALMGLLLGAVALVGQRERRKMRWDRPVTNPFMLAALNLLLFLGLVGAVGMVEAMVGARVSGDPLPLGDERVLYAILGFSAVLGAWLIALAAGLFGARLLRLVEERF